MCPRRAGSWATAATFYRFKELYETGGEAALAEISRSKANLKNRIKDSTEQRVVDLAIAEPGWGQVRAANELKKQGVLSPRLESAAYGCVMLEHQEAFKSVGSQEPIGRSDLNRVAGVRPGESRSGAQRPQTNGICERFHKTILNEFYRVTFRKKLYKTTEELQADLDQRLKLYNEERPRSGPMVLRQDADADLHRQYPVSQRKDVGGVSGGITTTDDENLSGDCELKC
jgi:hypothetical protein